MFEKVFGKTTAEIKGSTPAEVDAFTSQGIHINIQNFVPPCGKQCSNRCKPKPKKRNPIRFIPKLGVVVEQSGPVAKTPQFQTTRPVKGDWFMDATMTATQQMQLTVDPKDRKGNTAQIENGVWSTDNSDVLALTPDPNDQLKCLVTAVGPTTLPNIPARVFFTGDAKIGEGEVTVIGEARFNITAGQATVLNITGGTPTEQP